MLLLLINMHHSNARMKKSNMRISQGQQFLLTVVVPESRQRSDARKSNFR